MKKILNVLKALSDETRLRIINLLFVKELCVCDIMEVLKITQTKASRHLTYMRNAGLVADRKQAQWVYYSLVRDESMQFLESLVLDNLRSIERCNTDLVNLEGWLKKKKTSCS